MSYRNAFVNEEIVSKLICGKLLNVDTNSQNDVTIKNV